MEYKIQSSRFQDEILINKKVKIVDEGEVNLKIEQDILIEKFDLIFLFAFDPARKKFYSEYLAYMVVEPHFYNNSDIQNYLADKTNKNIIKELIISKTINYLDYIIHNIKNIDRRYNNRTKSDLKDTEILKMIAKYFYIETPEQYDKYNYKFLESSLKIIYSNEERSK